MNNVNDELRNRILSDDESFKTPSDPWRSALISRFDAKRKKLVLYATLQLVMGLAIFFAGALMLNNLPGLKLMLLAAVIMLVGFETTVLVKLWYWIAETNIRVTREIKQLQLLSVGHSADPQNESTGAPPHISGALSMRTAQWLSVATVVAATIIGVVLFLLPLGTAAPRAQLEEHIRIAGDGRCEVITRDQYPYAGVTPLDHIQVRSNIALENPAWHEARVGNLRSSFSRDDQAYVYTVRFPQPIFRGEEVDLRTFAGAPQLVTREGDRWTCRATWNWLSSRRPALTLDPARYHPTVRTVSLPPGAVVESVTPAPKMQWGDYDGSLTLSFERPDKPTPDEELRITYRLPVPGTTAPANH